MMKLRRYLILNEQDWLTGIKNVGKPSKVFFPWGINVKRGVLEEGKG